jgi:hypothetical protein
VVAGAAADLAVRLLGEGKAEVIVEREAFEDLIRQDRVPERLRAR